MTASSETGRHDYRIDIDGLRAIAILSVIVGHAQGNLLNSGYLGVDVFFVISGFVITGSLLSRNTSGFWNFIAAFFLRRAKRLLPALLACVLVTSVVIFFVDVSPEESMETGVSSLFGVSNFALFFQRADYFAVPIKYNAFAHTWSLGVEEQFYLLFPVIFWFFVAGKQQNGRHRLAITIALLSVASLISYLAFHKMYPEAAYYLMPMRFWELGTGALAAVFVNTSASANKETSKLLTPALIVALLAVFFMPASFAPWTHVVAVALTTALLLVGCKPDNRASILTNPVAVYIGKISYSLYLWHWPFLVFCHLAPKGSLNNQALAMVCAFAVACVSYHFVEQPIRGKSTPKPRRAHFVMAVGSVVCAALFIGVGFEFRKPIRTALFGANTEPKLPSGFLPVPIHGGRFGAICVVDGDKRLLKETTFSTCTIPPIKGGDHRTLWVLGDSHAGHLQALFVDLRNKFGFGFHLVETPGHAVPSAREKDFDARVKLMKQVRANWKRGDVVVLSRLYLTRTSPPAVYGNFHSWLEKVDAMAAELQPLGIDMVLFGPPPMFQYGRITECDRTDRTSCSVEREGLLQSVAEIHDSMDRLTKRYANVVVFKPFPILCPERWKECSPSFDGEFMFRDKDHFNVVGSASLTSAFHDKIKSLQR